MKKKTVAKRSILLMMGLVLIFVFVLAACGGAGGPEYADAASAPAYAPNADEGSAMLSTEDANGLPSPTGQAEDGSLPQNGQKIILNATVWLQTKEFDKTVSSLRAAIEKEGGYVSEADVSNEGSYSNAIITARIPANKYTSFLNTVEGTGTVTSRNETSEDITAQYIDVEARLATLKAKQKRLLELAAEAATLEDLLYLEDQLSEVQYELEYYSSIMRTFDNLVDYSTVIIHIDEVKEIVPVPEKTFWNRLSETFKQTWHNTGIFFQNLLLFVVAVLPVLLFLLVVLVVVFVLLRRSKKKQAAKAPASLPPSFPKNENPNP